MQRRLFVCFCRISLCFRKRRPEEVLERGSAVQCGHIIAIEEQASNFRRAPSVDIADLQPSNEDGEPVGYWAELATQMEHCSHQTCGEGHLCGQLFQWVPDATVIGRGTYGIVWRGTHKRTGKMFAVKNVEGSHNNALAMWEREREMVKEIRKCSHPCVVDVHSVREFSDVSGVYFVVMEYCSGGSMLDHIARQRRMGTLTDPYFPPATAHRWLGQVFLGLEHLHLRSGVLFRDLKPDNVVIDSLGCAKLTDFGVGRVGTEPKGGFSLGVPAGTPGYIAPELLRGELHDFKADLFSFGVLIWLLLTGGVAEKETPQPPHGLDEVHDFHLLFDDWRVIRDEAMTSSALQRCSMSSCGMDCTELVVSLVGRNPAARPDHDDIRAHPFMDRLLLPCKRAHAEAVEAWLRR